MKGRKETDAELDRRFAEPRTFFAKGFLENLLYDALEACWHGAAIFVFCASSYLILWIAFGR